MQPYFQFVCLHCFLLLSILAGILLGFAMIIVFLMCYCVPVVSANGKYDLLTELIMKCRPNEELEIIKEDCIKAAAGEEVGPGTEGTAARKGAEAGALLEPKHVVDEEDATGEVEKPHDPKVSFSGDEDYLEEAPEVAPSKSEEEET